MIGRSMLSGVLLLVTVACGTSSGSPDSAPDVAVDPVAPPDSPEPNEVVGGDVEKDAAPTTTPGGLPLALPFVYERATDGEPLTEAEIADFTARVTGFWKQIDYPIIGYFHQAATLLALTHGQPEVARQLVEGLALRIERYRDPASKEPGSVEASWGTDTALFMTRAAVVGLPLTAAEARDVQAAHLRSLEHYEAFPNWDLWAPTVPDGRYSFRDGYHPKGVPQAFDIEDYTSLLEYCWSPFKNPAGARFVDCAVVTDPQRWGTP
jgi:hypothetical protein